MLYRNLSGLANLSTSPRWGGRGSSGRVLLWCATVTWQFFVPAILADERMTAAVLPNVPSFRFLDEESADVARRAAVPLTVLGGLLALVIAGAGVGLGRVRGAD